MVGLVLEALALVSEGQVAEGMGRLDEATAAATGGELGDLNAVGAACCYLIFRPNGPALDAVSVQQQPAGVSGCLRWQAAFGDSAEALGSWQRQCPSERVDGEEL